MKQKSYSVLYRFARCLIAPYVKSRYSFRTDLVPEQEEPFLLVSNHTTEDDMFFTLRACARPMYFVCGEHLLRNKYYGKLLRSLCNPIPVPKGGATLSAVMQMLKRLKAGDNLCIFHEGKRSYHGETIPASRALGSLVKKAGCALVTYRIVGGYFTYPRWARGNKRRGHAEGKVVGVYSSAQLAELSAEEITEIINRDTYENAYRTQREKKWVYRGKNLAEGLETVLFLCPRCGGEDTIRTHGDDFRCSCCGLSGTYDRYGFLTGENLPYDNVLDWMRWIEEEYDCRVGALSEGACVYAGNEVTLYRMNEDYTNCDLCTSDFHIYADRMEIGTYSYEFKKVPYMSVLYGNNILFTYGGGYYGLIGDHFKAWKCARLWHLYRGDTHDKTKEI